jgi:hypothetical protein
MRSSRFQNAKDGYDRGQRLVNVNANTVTPLYTNHPQSSRELICHSIKFCIAELLPLEKDRFFEGQAHCNFGRKL